MTEKLDTLPFEEDTIEGREEFFDEFYSEDELNDMKKINDRKLNSVQHIVYHCKPTFAYQSIEFDYQSDGSAKDLDNMINLFADILKRLQAIAPEQDKKPAISEPLATPGQKATMEKFGIFFDNKTTKKQAQALIQASIDGFEKWIM